MTATIDRPSSPTATRHRPLTLLALGSGAVAACIPLAVCLAVALAGWFLSDAGAHGAPRDALRTGATAWLMAHGSGVTIGGATVTVMPLGLTVLAVWSVWRCAVQLGESLADHGPDAEALADGDRDWTVPAATTAFAATYLLVAVLVGVLAGTAATAPALGPVVGWSVLLSALLGGCGVAAGSGRAAVWLALLPAEGRASVATAAGVLRLFLAASAVALLAALAVDLGAAVNVLSRMHTDTGDAVLYLLVTALLLPNAVLFSGAYLLGPGFAVGTGTLVSPTVVAVGPVPTFPLLAALPDSGPVPVWTPWLVLLPAVLAAVAVVRQQRRLPVPAWDVGALRGLAGGVLAGVTCALLAAVAGGAAGPGRMRDVGPAALDVLVHGVVAFGVGGLLGGVVATWWVRRRHRAGTADGSTRP